MDSQLCVGIFIGIIIVVVILAIMRGKSSPSSGKTGSGVSRAEPETGKLKKGMSKSAEPTKVPTDAEQMRDKHAAKSKAIDEAERKSKYGDSSLNKKRVESEPAKTIGVKVADDAPSKVTHQSKSGGLSKSRVDDEPHKKGKLTKSDADESDDGPHGVMK